MAVIEIPAEQRFVISCTDWDQYVGFSDMLGERHVRVTYDRGQLEFMTLSFEHERWKKWLGRLVEALSEELDVDIASCGSATCRREDLDQGLEADESYWIEHEPLVRGRTDIDLTRDPPPDLALEVEISRSAIDRMGIYARLKVPEVWCWNGRKLRVFLLAADGQYVESKHSHAFPQVPMKELERFLVLNKSLSEMKLLRKFRIWVREQIALGWKTSSKRNQSVRQGNGGGP